MKEGDLVKISDEDGVYVLTAYDSVNDEWDFKEFCICQHSCAGGRTASKNIKEIKAVKK
jgi:hypothetical protein